jgi:hypothetical protein
MGRAERGIIGRRSEGEIIISGAARACFRAEVAGGGYPPPSLKHYLTTESLLNILPAPRRIYIDARGYSPVLPEGLSVTLERRTTVLPRPSFAFIAHFGSIFAFDTLLRPKKRK